MDSAQRRIQHVMNTLQQKQQNPFDAMCCEMQRTSAEDGPIAGFKVAVLGAAGGIGQPLSLLMKLSPYVSELNLYDVAPVVLGVAADLSHIETKVKVTGFKKEDLAAALAGVDLVIIPAGVPRKPGMTRDDLFGINAGIVKTLIEGCATSCPKAMIAIISNPVNSTVPIASEVLKKHGVYNPKKLIGVTTLDIVRSNTFVGEKLGVDPVDVSVPVIGGHAGVTILPLLSQSVPPYHPTDEVRATLTKRIQNAGTEVVEAKAGAGSATLSMAYAGARMGVSILKGLSGRRVMECGFVQSTVVDGLPFFATQIALGPNGVEEVTGTGALNAFEQQKLEELKPGLKASIDKGIKFVTGN